MEIRTQDGQVMFEAEFRQHTKENGGGTWETTTPEILASLGAVVLLEGAQATPTTHYQYSMRDGVEQIDGVWYTKYSLGPVFTDTTVDNVTTTAQEHQTAYQAQKDAEQAATIRQQRDAKLTACDWTQTPDNPIANKTAWATYRQALRDLPSATGFPWDMTWPEEPK